MTPFLVGYLMGLGGLWLLSDCFYSLILYHDKPDEKWWRNHSIRVIRGIIGIGFMAMGWVLLAGQ